MLADLPEDARLARRGFDRFIGELHQRRVVKTGGKALQPQRGHVPVAIAPRTRKQVQLALDTLHEGRAQFKEQSRIVARSRRQRGIDGFAELGHRTIFNSHC